MPPWVTIVAGLIMLTGVVITAWWTTRTSLVGQLLVRISTMEATRETHDLQMQTRLDSIQQAAGILREEFFTCRIHLVEALSLLKIANEERDEARRLLEMARQEITRLEVALVASGASIGCIERKQP